MKNTSKKLKRFSLFAHAKLQISLPPLANRTAKSMTDLNFLLGQEIAALAGLAPWDRCSGKYDGKAHIWGGRKDVHSVPYMAALTSSRCNPTIRKFAQHLQQQGKAFKVVITACMRKLLIILNTMIRNQTLWTPKIYLKNT